jgi:DNA-binding FadR family transcriptional regulator
MSIRSLSSAAVGGLFTNQQSSMQQNFRALTQAIESGNAAGAQQAFATLNQSMPKPKASAQDGNPAQDPLSNLANALKSGDMSAAKSAMQALQQNMPAPRRREPAPQPPADDNSSTSQSSAPSVVTGPVRVLRLEA